MRIQTSAFCSEAHRTPCGHGPLRVFILMSVGHTHPADNTVSLPLCVPVRTLPRESSRAPAHLGVRDRSCLQGKLCAEIAARPRRWYSRPQPGVLGSQGDEPAASLSHTCLQVKMNLKPAGAQVRELLILQSLGHPSKARNFLQQKPAL